MNARKNEKKQEKHMKDKAIDILMHHLYIDVTDDEIHGQYDCADEILRLFNYNENESVWHD
jgi:hypothetical protein